MTHGTSSWIYLKYLRVHVANDGFGSSLQDSQRNVGRPRSKHVSVRHCQRSKQPLWRRDGDGRHANKQPEQKRSGADWGRAGPAGQGGPPFVPWPVSFAARTVSQHYLQTPASLWTQSARRHPFSLVLMIEPRVSRSSGQLFTWLTWPAVNDRKQMISLSFDVKWSLNIDSSRLQRWHDAILGKENLIPAIFLFNWTKVFCML